MEAPVAQWATVSGFFVPLVMAVINQPKWSKELKTLLHFVVCMAVAAIQLQLDGTLTPSAFFPNALAVLSTSIVIFHGVMKPSGLADVVEVSTSPRSALREDVDAE